MKATLGAESRGGTRCVPILNPFEARHSGVSKSASPIAAGQTLPMTMASSRMAYITFHRRKTLNRMEDLFLHVYVESVPDFTLGQIASGPELDVFSYPVSSCTPSKPSTTPYPT